MDIVDEKEPLGSVGKVRHIKISRRDSIQNDLKNSTPQGLVSFALSLLSLLICLITIFFSFQAEGKAGILAGVVILLALLIAIIAFVLAIQGFKNKSKIRHYMERRSIILSSIIIIGLVILFVRGIVIFFSK